MPHYSVTDLEPMLRAVPSIMCRACSMSRALRSAIFSLDDLVDLGDRHLADLLLVRHARTLGDAGRLLQQRGGRRALRDEVERCGRCRP